MNPILKVIFVYLTILVVTILLGAFMEIFHAPMELILPQLAPGIVGLLAVYVFRDSEIKKFPNDSSHPRLTLFALIFLAPIISGLAFLALFFAGGVVDRFETAESIPLLLLWMPVGALGEELGWRSYLQRILRRNFPPLLAFSALGVLWTLWHVGNFQYGIIFMIGQLLFLTGFSIIIGLISEQHGNNIWFATFAHIGINLTFMTALFAGFSNPIIILVYGVFWIVSSVIIYLKFSNHKSKDSSDSTAE